VRDGGAIDANDNPHRLTILVGSGPPGQDVRCGSRGQESKRGTKSAAADDELDGRNANTVVMAPRVSRSTI
jgi:hypothetical protein